MKAFILGAAVGFLAWAASVVFLTEPKSATTTEAEKEPCRLSDFANDR